MLRKFLELLLTWLSSPYVLFSLLAYVAAIVVTACIISLMTSDLLPIFSLLTFICQAIRYLTTG